MRGPLHGIRVVELSTMITAPFAGMLLADMGADVVKVENPDGGDPFRQYGGGDYSAQFCSYNRNKRSVALSLKSDLGRRAFGRLVARADVLLDNFRPGVLDRLGFGQDTLKSLNPNIIHCSITGFGNSGPYVDRPCYDAIAQALAGMSSQFLDPEEPRLAGITIPDNVTGQYAAFGIVSALLEKNRSGLARRLEVNMLEAAIAFMPEPFAYFTQNGEKADAYLRIRNSQAFSFRCKDGGLVVTHLSSRQKFWEEFAQVAGRPDWIRDSRFDTLEKRVANYECLHAEAAGEFGSHDQQEWLARFEGRDVPFAAVNQIDRVFDDAQVQHLDSFMETPHPQKGPLLSPRRPILIDGQRQDQPRQAPPLLGQHTEEVLRELGLDSLAVGPAA